MEDAAELRQHLAALAKSSDPHSAWVDLRRWRPKPVIATGTYSLKIYFIPGISPRVFWETVYAEPPKPAPPVSEKVANTIVGLFVQGDDIALNPRR